MNLPIFQENLRSSAGWASELERQVMPWRESPADARVRARELQVREAVARTPVAEAFLAANFLAASQLTGKWAAIWAQSSEPHLDLGRLMELHNALTGKATLENGFRTKEGSRLGEYHDPAPPSIVPRLVDNALDWFQTPSFGEIHPVEQATIAHLRMLDLQPFASMNAEIAHLTASFYTERAGLPPLVLFSGKEEVTQYEGAREAAFRMLTQPLVELLSNSLVRTIRMVLA
ncbi:MAG: Fic family protein [Acidobacteriota bacterium]